MSKMQNKKKTKKNSDRYKIKAIILFSNFLGTCIYFSRGVNNFDISLDFRSHAMSNFRTVLDSNKGPRKRSTK